MTTSSSSFPSSPFAHAATEKLTEGNQAMWGATVLSAIRGAQMAKYLDVEQPAPPIQIDVTSSDGKTTAKAPNPDFQTWDACILHPFADHQRPDRPRNLQKGNLSITDYVGKIRTLCDELIAAGKRVNEEDIVSHILAGLDEEFDPVVSAMCSRMEPVTAAELFSQLLSFETRLNLRGGGSQSSANTATRGHKQGGGGGDHGRRQAGNGGDRGGRG
nr:uncharacterized protein LOC109784358 [Aegilops tauschii subsp. strangulata]